MTGAGDDSVTTGGGADQIDTGAGGDTVVVVSSEDNGTIDTGDGDDLVRFSGTVSVGAVGSIDGGDGTDTVKLRPRATTPVLTLPRSRRSNCLAPGPTSSTRPS